MIEKIKEMIRENSMCVLATCYDNKPHCSLMAYWADRQAECIYMVTRKDTNKYKNLLKNPRVSLLIDTRAGKGPEERAAVQALTIAGTCAPVREQREKGSVGRQLVNQHPHLKELAEHPDADIICVQLDSFLLLDGPMKAYYAAAKGPAGL